LLDPRFQPIRGHRQTRLVFRIGTGHPAKGQWLVVRRLQEDLADQDLPSARTERRASPDRAFSG
jgi:hypothetical protein